MLQKIKISLLILLGLVTALNPILSIYAATPARAADTETDTDSNIADQASFSTPIPNQNNFSYTPESTAKFDAKVPDGYQNAVDTLNTYSDPNSVLSMDDLFNTKSGARLILPTQDLNQLKKLSCLEQILPDYSSDYGALYRDLPQTQKNDIDSAVAKEKNEKKPRYSNYKEYFSFLVSGTTGQPESEKIQNRDLFRSYVTAAEKSYTNDKMLAAWNTEAGKLGSGQGTSVGLSTLSCLTGKTTQEIQGIITLAGSGNNQYSAYLQTAITSALDSLKIDIRVIKTLVYLITPKDQGGAGHWRIKVSRLIQTAQKSNESDSVNTGSSSSGSASTVACSADMTAADCGRQNNLQPTAVATNQDGSQYDVYLSAMQSQEDQFLQQLSADEKNKTAQQDSKNISAHFAGEAVDISEIDDIRCTKIKVPNTALGGSVKKEAQTPRPIKLAWQTEQGWAQSGGSNDFDMMSLLRSIAMESLTSFFDEMGDPSSYDGDISSASFDTIIGLLGRSILGQIMNSPGHNLDGFDANDTLQKLGSMYIADYLGLPREIFLNQNLTDVSSIQYAIGRAAIEKRLGLPFGSLDSINNLSGTNLQKLLKAIGRRKIEYEANLTTGSLDDYYAKTVTGQSQSFGIYLGKRVIEKELNLKQGTWPDGDFSAVATAIGDLHAGVIRVDPNSIDSLLNIASGSTSKLIKNEISAASYAQIVGEARAKDTLYGLRYFQANSSAYQLPGPTKDHPEIPDTWSEALKGNQDALQTIGIYTTARVLGEKAAPAEFTDPNAKHPDAIQVTENGVIQQIQVEEFGQFAFREWLRQNISQTDCKAGASTLSLNYNINNTGSTIYNGTVATQTSKTVIDTAPTVTLNYSLVYNNSTTPTPTIPGAPTASSSSSSASEPKPTLVPKTNVIQKLPETLAKNAGLENFDLQRIFGCSQADGRAVFQRIGAKLLYVGIANNILSSGERTKIDLMETNPSLNIDNPTVNFYVTRALKVADLSARIKQDAKAINTNDLQLKEIKNTIDRITGSLSKLYNITDPDILKTQNIVKASADIIIDLDQLRDQLSQLHERYLLTKNKTADELQKVNVLIADVDELIHTVSEIIAGKEISTSANITLAQINTAGLNGNNTGSGSGTSGLSTAEMAKLIYLFLAGKISAGELFLRIGANAAESSLDLPPNTLLYMIQNYQQRGSIGADSLFMALGQAEIEQQLGMPAYYFQGFSIETSPDFTDPATVQRWLPDDNPYKHLDAAKFKDFWNNLSNPGTTANDPLIGGPQDYINALRQIVESAKSNWQRYRQGLVAKYGNIALGEINLDDVVKNIEARDIAGTGSGQNDLLARFGFPQGRYSELKSNNPVAWSTAVGRSVALDNIFSISQGSTKSLFTEETSLFNTGAGNDEKHQLEAKLNLPSNVIDKYIQLLNGEIVPSERNEFMNADIPADYTGINPYANSSSACPISYTTQNGFQVNNTSLENNSFCYYDKKGRHCFPSMEEAQRYANENKADKLTGILPMIASSMSQNGADGSQSIASITGLDYAAILDRLTKFVNSSAYIKSTDEDHPTSDEDLSKHSPKFDSVFTTAEWSKLEASSPVSVSLLKKLFSRESVNLPVPNYKKMVGQTVAKNILTSKLFGALGIDIDPSLFDGSDLFAILNGDFSSLGRIATGLIDKELGLPPGTTLVIYNAKTAAARSCALKQVGEAMLGNIFGLDYVSLSGNPIVNIGQAKIEQTLGFAKDTFRGADITELVNNVRPINFVAAFKIPLPSGTIDKYLEPILGKSRAAAISGATTDFKIQTLKTYLSSTAAISNTALAAVSQLENYITTTFLPGFLAKLKTSPDQIPVKIQNSPDELSGNDKEQYYAVKSFFDRLVEADNLLSLDHYKTYELLTGLVSPHDYSNLVGEKLAIRVGIVDLASILGLNPEQSQAAADLILNIKNVFTCSTNSVANGASCKDVTYHNWGMIYKNLDVLFHFRLDDRLNLPPGTAQRLFSDPTNTIPVMLEIGAQKLDAQFQLDSSNIASFTGLYREFYGNNSGGNPGDDLKCHEQAYPGGMDVALNAKLSAEKKEIERLAAYRPRGTPTMNPGESATDYFNRIANDPASTQEQKDWAKQSLQAQQNLQQTQAEIQSRDEQEHTCRVAARQSGNGTQHDINGNPLPTGWQGHLWEWLQNAVAEKIQEVIYNVKVKNADGSYTRIGVLMPIADIRQMMGGDMRYLEITLTALTANIVMIPIDSLGTTNCNEEVSGSCRTAVPEEFRITYADIRMAYVGIPQMDAYHIAAYEEIMGDPVANPGSGGDGFTDSFLDSFWGSGSTDPNTTIQNQYSAEYGYTPAEYNALLNDPNLTPEQKDLLLHPEQYYNPNYNLPNKNDKFSSERNDRLEKIQSRARQIALENLEYKMLDIALWKLDAGIFPGFAKAIIKGNMKEKAAALAKYLRNGLRNGYILGFKFSPIADGWVQVAKFVKEKFIDNNPDAFKNFIADGGFDFLAGFISQNSTKALGFEITPDMAQGLLLGAGTGEWGLQAISVDGVMQSSGHESSTVAGRKIPTLGGALINFGLGKLFSWTDKALGLQDGQSYEVYKASVAAYKAWKDWKSATDATKVVKASQLQAAEIQLAHLIVGMIVQKLLGKLIGQWEESLGMMPGTLMPLITNMVYEFVAAPLLSLIFGGNWSLMALGPWGWISSVIIAVLGWMLGGKYYYYCDADGYYPELGQPDYAKNDISGLGVWGGRIKSNGSTLEETVKQYSILSAQYKASRLIGDMLSIQYNSKYNDNAGLPTIPIQIMTGRVEDVKSWDSMIASNMCQAKLGTGATSFNGVCGFPNSQGLPDGSDIRLGVWANPQTVAWTHVGF